MSRPKRPKKVDVSAAASAAAEAAAAFKKSCEARERLQWHWNHGPLAKRAREIFAERSRRQPAPGAKRYGFDLSVPFETVQLECLEAARAELAERDKKTAPAEDHDHGR